MNVGRGLAIGSMLLDAFASGPSSVWCPHEPFPKQKEWIALDVLESTYGGGAGGGKSDALLASALRFVHVSKYSALILRRTFPDLALPGAIMDRSHDWLDETKAKWHEREKQWTFPGGAVLQFGYCDTEQDLARYKSAEFQFIGIDELTEWPEAWYAFLFSRLRRLAGMNVPLRMRAGTNPDGIGAPWVRERFGIPEGRRVEKPIWKNSSRVFYPALAEDNPALDLPAYENALEQMTGGRDGVKWKQLREGLWIRDDEGLVYRFSPTVNRASEVTLEPREQWHFLLGIDYGFKDDCAFSVLGWRDHSPVVFVVESEKQTEMIPSDAAQHVASLEARYHFECIVGDVGGLGKGYAEEARKRWGIPIEQAEKNNKRGYIDLLNGALRSRQLMVMPGNDELEREWNVLPWAEGRQKESPGFANHLSDATLYAWRKAWAFRERPVVVKTLTLEERESEEEQRLAREVDRPKRGDRSWVKRMAERK